MPSNWYMFFVAGLIPILVGMVYYNKNVIGNTWMKLNGFTENTLKEKNPNMVVIMGMTYLFSVMIAFIMSGIVIHQTSVYSMMMPEVMQAGSEAETTFNELMKTYGERYRGFRHGAVHGIFLSIFIALPVIGINALFEMRGWKYILLHFVYWLVSLALMGGLICSTLTY